MLNEVGMFLASYGYFGGSIGNALNQLEQMGFFYYVLPFLLIFSLVFGILSSMQLFKDNRAVDAVIALAVGLMALQFDIVPVFFSQVFPRVGVALAAVLVILILAGFFVDPKKSWIMYAFLGIGAIAAIAVLVSTSQNVGFYSSYMLSEYAPLIIMLVFCAVVIAAVLGAFNKPSKEWDLGPWRIASKK